MYCIVDDLKKAIPEDNLIQLTDDEDAGSINITRAEAAIVDATELIDSYLLGRYTLPLDPVPIVIKRLCVDISIYYLYARLFERDMPTSMEDRYKNSIKLLDKISTGQISFAQIDDSDATPSMIRVNKTADDRIFPMNDLNF